MSTLQAALPPLLADHDTLVWESVADRLAGDVPASELGPPMWADPSVTAETFDPHEYLAGFDRLDSPTYRRRVTAKNPLLFALVYLPAHLTSEATGDQITFADAHLDWCRRALRWTDAVEEPRSQRHAEIAPRETGKTTFWFLILPLWAAAHGYIRFAAAFADSTGQAETHLTTFKRELDTNERLRRDYPDLCAPARRRSGNTVADRQGMLHQRSGFTFAARGIDSSNLGLKVGRHRPDLILLDDVEPDEASYSAALAAKRLATVTDAILPMNLLARVVLIGTVTMPGSIVHQLVRAAAGEPPAEWITTERFTAYHAKPIVVRDDGSERSIWPAKWPMSLLNELRGTRSYRKNFDNDPLGSDGGFWVETDFRYGSVEGVVAQVLSVDPAVTTKKTSDFTGLAIVGYIPPRVTRDGRDRPVRVPSKCVVEEAWEVRLVGEALRAHVLGLLARWPRVRAVLVETNQGGENWAAILHHLPPGIRLATVHQTRKKEVRAADTLALYQRGRVQHAKKLVRCEEQMCAFPKAAHDDMVDAVCSAVLRLLVPANTGRAATEYQR